MMNRKRHLSSTGSSSSDDFSSSDNHSPTKKGRSSFIKASKYESQQEDNLSSDGQSPTKKARHEFDEAPPSSSELSSGTPLYSSFAQKMMAQMGYKKGKGLGKNETGRVDIVEASNQRGRRGLGLKLKGLEAKTALSWEEEEEILVRQEPDWIPTKDQAIPTLNELNSYITMTERKETIDDEFEFCEPEILTRILESKNIFDNLGGDEFLKARFRANPYETIRGAIFQNRAAMKMAEVDASFDYMFTNHPDRNEKDPTNLLYFADICAGPGGFSEYILWRKKWHSKGFGFTLRADWANDFKLDDFIAGTPETFDCHYGENGYNGDGDIFKDKNLTAFREYVLENSDGMGLYFVMADGGFSVEGQENIQEILSKQLYLGQFICALGTLRPGGHFICKLFDIFTPFSVGLVYLMYRAFERVCIFKPVTSRPANSERYIVCKSLRKDSQPIYDYLFDVNIRINGLKGSNIDIREIVPVSLMRDDKEFYEYIFTSNNTIGARQILGLQKLATYVQNTTLVGQDQGEVRKQCLAAWTIPSEARSNVIRNDPETQFEKLIKHAATDWMRKQPTFLTEESVHQIKSIHDYKCTFSGGDRVYLFSLGRQSVYKWNPRDQFDPAWKRLDKMNLELPRFTLLDAELVFELKGDGRGQRRVMAVHILDVHYLGGEYVGDKPFSERIKYADGFAKALSKPCRPDVVRVRVKQFFAMTEMSEVLDALQVKHMKRGMERKLCSNVEEDKYFVPTGLYLIRRVKEPWHLQFSRSNKRFYFYNPHGNKSLFEPPKDSLSDVKYCVSSRFYWKWEDNLNLDLDSSKEGVLTKAAVVDFVTGKV